MLLRKKSLQRPRQESHLCLRLCQATPTLIQASTAMDTSAVPEEPAAPAAEEPPLGEKAADVADTPAVPEAPAAPAAEKKHEFPSQCKARGTPCGACNTFGTCWWQNRGLQSLARARTSQRAKGTDKKEKKAKKDGHKKDKDKKSKDGDGKGDAKKSDAKPESKSKAKKRKPDDELEGGSWRCCCTSRACHQKAARHWKATASGMCASSC